VQIVDPYNLKKFEQIIEEQTAREELSVIITKRPCALLPAKRKPAFEIVDDSKVTDEIMKIGCPAIQKTKDSYVIDSALCVGCGLCVRVSRPGAIKAVKV